MAFKSKMTTDLYLLAKRKTYALSATISPNCTYFSIVTKDRHVHIYNLKTAKVFRTIVLGSGVFLIFTFRSSNLFKQNIMRRVK